MLFVHVEEHKVLRFEKGGSGLYFLDTTKDTITNEAVTNYSVSCISTVASNKENFSRREIEGADTAIILQGRVGWPSQEEYKHMSDGNLLINAAATSDNISRAEAIYGEGTQIIKSKMTRKRPEHISKVKCV